MSLSKQVAQLNKRLLKCRTEEEVKAAWAKAFDLSYDTGDDHDLYHRAVLFEFKHDKNLANTTQLATVVAQVLYYLHRLKFGQTDKAIPPHFCIADKNECLVASVPGWKSLYTDEAGLYDWDLRPSSPDRTLVQAVKQHSEFHALHVRDMRIEAEAEAIFTQLETLLAPQARLEVGDKKTITEANFEDVFDFWNAVFGESVHNGFKASRYFVADIQEGQSIVRPQAGKVLFKVAPEEFREKKILADDYERFWSIYEKVRSPETQRGILAKIDRLTDEVDRRKHGEFFTPLLFAQKSLHYLDREFGPKWLESGEYRLWDMAAGTGNLQYYLPTAALPNVYLSTLYKEDVEHCTRIFPGATVFQYDYLNDDVGNLFKSVGREQDRYRFDLSGSITWKLPEKLRNDLANPNLKWVILINPPFATAQKGGATGSNKADVSKTKIRTLMHSDNLGEVSRELFAQFLYRIRHEFAGKAAWLGLFSKLKYVNAPNDQKLRETLFQFTFCRGLMFSSVNFSGTSRASQFPVGFLLWNLAIQKHLSEQNIMVDVFDTQVQKTGKKRFTAGSKSGFLSTWIKRPPTASVFPPFSSAITIKGYGPDIRNRIAKDFIGSLMCMGNDIQHQNMTSILSGPYASAGAHSITPEIFEQSMVVHAVRRAPKAEWHNDRDQFQQPNQELPEEFFRDCVAWSLFATSNQTAALRDVEYAGTTYQVLNHFFPVQLATLREWTIDDSDIRVQLPTAEDRFVAKWLAEKPEFSEEAQTVLAAGFAVYRLYFASLSRLRTTKFKIQTWDAGWFQIRSALKDRSMGEAELAAVTTAENALREKLREGVVAYGFLP
ncbi:MAG: hypothetical protein AB9900_11605 [Humidesulfovibrio sp.]